MSRVTRWIVALAVLQTGALASADDLTGSDKFLCAPMAANTCWPDEGCEQKGPWALNMPMFIEVNLRTKRLSTTEASGLNRATDIKNLLREEGLIVLQGYQTRRAFSIVITEESGIATFSVAGDDEGAVVFGACTPQP